MVDVDNRKHKRYASQSPIMYSNYFENPYCYYGAQMLNYSMGGMYLVSQYVLEPGSVINLRKAIYGVDSVSPKTDELQWGRIVWSRKMRSADKFGYGVTTTQIDSAGSPEKEKVRHILEFADPTKTIETADPTEPIKVICENPQCKITQLELQHAKEVADSRSKKLEILNHFASAISSTLDLNKILKIICKEMVDIFDARNTGIGLLNRDKTKITLVAFYTSREEESDVTGMEIPIVGNAATIHVIEHGETIIVPDVQHNPITASYHDIAFARGTQSVMIVPLLARGEVIGTIGLPTSDKNQTYSRADVTLAQTIASQITSVIENARVHEDTEKAKEQAEQELKIGRDIQAGFLPERLPNIPGWEIASHFKAAHMVAGDFYDIFPLDNGGKIGFVVADVCDKGVGAALYMALFRTLIRASTIQRLTGGSMQNDAIQPPPDDILKNTITLTNNYIASTHSEANMFATIFFGILDPETGHLAYINGGHESPLIISNNKIKAQLKSTGPAVGMFPNINYSVAHFQMDIEDILFGFTDGLTDAQNQTGEFFGNKRLQELLTQSFPSANQMINRVVTNIDQHILGTEQFDDITILVIQRMKEV